MISTSTGAERVLPSAPFARPEPPPRRPAGARRPPPARRRRRRPPHRPGGRPAGTPPRRHLRRHVGARGAGLAVRPASRRGRTVRHGAGRPRQPCGRRPRRDRRRPATTAFSVPRDVVVSTADGPGRLALSWRGGPQQTVDALCGLGIPADHLVAVDLAGFQDVVDAAGGLDVEVPVPVRDPAAGLLLTRSGRQHVDGATALALVRSRHPEHLAGGTWVPAVVDPDGRADAAGSVLRALIRQVARPGATPGGCSRSPGPRPVRSASTSGRRPPTSSAWRASTWTTSRSCPSATPWAEPWPASRRRTPRGHSPRPDSPADPDSGNGDADRRADA